MTQLPPSVSGSEPQPPRNVLHPALKFILSVVFCLVCLLMLMTGTSEAGGRGRRSVAPRHVSPARVHRQSFSPKHTHTGMSPTYAHRQNFGHNHNYNHKHNHKYKHKHRHKHKHKHKKDGDDDGEGGGGEGGGGEGDGGGGDGGGDGGGSDGGGSDGGGSDGGGNDGGGVSGGDGDAGAGAGAVESEDPGGAAGPEGTEVVVAKDVLYGMEITALYKGTAAKKGLELGDVILKVNGTPTPNFEALTKALAQSGGRAEVLVLREDGDDDEPETVTLYPVKGIIGVSVEPVIVD